ncbi:MAG: hypothetical protein ACK5KT_17230 [Dysgonomonas sp.]
MKYTIYLILTILYLSTSETIAQTKFSGIVLSSENNAPIERAIIQFGDMPDDYTLSGKNGNFSIPEKHNDIIYIRSIGYLPRSILFSNFASNNIILLDISPIELNPIEITPEDVNSILINAIANLKNKLSKGEYLKYSLQLKQKEEYSDEEQEINIEYAARLDKVKDKDLSFTLKKINVQKLKTLPQDATSKSLKKNIFNIEYHLKAFDSKHYLDKYKITKANSPDGLIILSASPKNKKKQDEADYRFQITRLDTVLQSISINVDYKDAEDEFKSFGTRKYKINKANTDIKFAQKDGKYYLSECLQILEILLLYKDGNKEKIISYSDSKLSENNTIPSDIDKLQKLNGHSRKLFSK